MKNFKVFDVVYNLEPENNKDIPIFDAFVEDLSSGRWEQNTFEVFKKCRDVNKSAIDIGAWIGPTTIWLSNNFKSVVAVDADIRAIGALKQNLSTSNCNNVHVIDKPVHSLNLEVIFGANQYVEFFKQQGLGCSTSQIRAGSIQDGDYTIPTVTLRDLGSIVPLEEVGFVKVDIEGGEELILEDLAKLGAQYNWKLWVSFHYDWWKDRDIGRFTNLFSQAKYIGVDGSSNQLHGDFTECIRNNPFTSLYIEY